MKNVFLLVLAFGSSLVYGQDYYSPTDKDKEPLARFPVDLSVSAAYPHRMAYTLPPELTGSINRIVLDEKSPENSAIRFFSNSKGTVLATCMGETQNPGCVVQHKGLAINREASNQAIAFRFADPDLRSAARDVARSFDSGNEPIGFIGSIKRRNEKTEWRQPTGVWTGFYQFDKAAATTVKIDFNSGLYYTQSSQDPKQWQEAGRLSTINWTTYHASGIWTAQGSSGWFDFSFNVESNRFEGGFAVFGSDPNGSKNYPKRQGRWLGTKMEP